MVRVKPLSTRVSPETYSKLLTKCASQGCSTYEYLGNLVRADVGILPEEPVEEEPLPENQTKLVIENDGNDERRIKIID